MRILFLLPTISMALVAQAPMSVEAPITRVRLHPDEAWVTRTARVRLPSGGTHRILLESLPTGLRVEDLQASAKGPAGLRLGDISVASDVRVVTETAEWKKLEGERDTLRDKRDLLEAQGEAAQQEITFLKNLQAAHDRELSSRMTYAVPNPAGVVELGRSIQTRLADLLTGERRRKREIEKIAREEGRINAELQKRASERRTAPSRVTVEVTATQEGTVDMELSYRTRAARWRPMYEARLAESRKKLDLTLYAAVTQSTGESWKDVRLEISNARPSRSLAVPVYSAGQTVDWMKQVPVAAYAEAPVMREMADARVQTMGSNIMPSAPPAPAPEEAVESSASMIEEASGLAATFLVEGLKDVPSDNEPHRFKVQGKELQPMLTLFATPRLDPTAYLLARFTAPGGLPLFPGSMVVRFAGNQRLGEAPLAIPAAGQPFSLGFGPYKAVRVAFRRVDHKLEQVGFSKERQWSLKEQIELDNDGSEPLEVEVQDRILKSASEQVRITLAPEFTAGWTEPVPGVRSWKLTLAPKEGKRLELPLTVRAPKDGVVTGMEDILPGAY